VTRFVVDASVLMRLASDGREASKRHELLAPTLVRSHTLSALHEAVHAGKLPPTSRAITSSASGA
jgi:hypothetical protein